MLKVLAAAVVAAGLVASPVQAQTQGLTPEQRPADQADLDSFPLNEGTLARLVATAYDLNKAHVPLRLSTNLNATELTDSLASSPDTVAILDKHGFTPHSFAVTVTTAASAALVVMAKKIRLPSMAKGVHVSEADIDFYRAHKDQIDKAIGVR